ncbi:unnamed protein product [Aureobasidium pullulans]|nr:unnamed protein product [Aureobasidium pullulans]
MSANNFTGTNPSGANHPTTTDTTTTSTTSTAGTHGANAGEGLKGMFAKGHSIRGNINSAIDGFTGDSASMAKNEQVARGGEQEFQTGNFVKKGTMDKAL